MPNFLQNLNPGQDTREQTISYFRISPRSSTAVPAAAVADGGTVPVRDYSHQVAPRLITFCLFTL
jgi:hypothetical protein